MLGAHLRHLHKPQEGLCAAPQGPPGLGLPVAAFALVVVGTKKMWTADRSNGIGGLWLFI